MKGLEGKADANKDNDITNGELLAYMIDNVILLITGTLHGRDTHELLDRYYKIRDIH